MLAGDFNVIPTAEDVNNPAAWVNDALFRPTTRESFQSLLGLGLTDALRAVTDAPGQYTFWDYQAGAWQKNHGLRIDHLLLSPQASDRLSMSASTVMFVPGKSRRITCRSGSISIWRRAVASIARPTAAAPRSFSPAALHPVLKHLQRHRAVVLGCLRDRLVVAVPDPGLVRRGAVARHVSHINPRAACRGS